METVISLDQEPTFATACEPSALAREALDGLPIAVALAVRREGVVEPELIYGNQAFERLTGARPSPEVSCRLADLSASRRSPQDEQRLCDCFVAGQAASETLLLGSHGKAEELVCQWSPLRGFAGAGAAWSVTLTRRDALAGTSVEQRLLRSEQEAAHSRALLIEAIESMTDGFVWFDSANRLVLCNQKYRDLYPKLADDLKAGASYADLMKLAFERGQFTVLADNERAIRKSLPKQPTFRTKTSEGRWIEAHNNALECGGFIGIRFDITSRVAAEERLIDAIESISGGFALFDADDRLVLCNEAYRNRAPGDGFPILEGMRFEEIVRANAYGGCVAGLAGAAEREAWIAQRMAAHREARGSFEIDWHDGRTYLMTDRRTHDGGIATVSTDITELRQARENAERANRAKTRFLAAASHDLRQPLHAMELFVAALEATAAGDEARAIVGDLREACNAVGRLLNALVDVSELESGKLVARFSDLPIQQLLDRMVRVYEPQARERGLALRLVPSSQVVRSDPHLLERILGNLLSNAVRYTPEGRILLGCRRRRGKLRIEVWDTGPGIPAEERQRIFEEFHQIDNVARERSRGVGLGLAIVRRLANALGHEIFLQSVSGRGSMFAVELDLASSPVAILQRTPLDAAMPRRTMVLVIDDDQQIRKGMARALESWGCTVQTAGDYDAAAAIAAATPKSIDLIIADYRLPRACNGVRAAGRLRALCGRAVPVLIVTADQGREELQEIAGQGFLALHKPVDPDALRGAIANLLEGFTVPASDAART